MNMNVHITGNNVKNEVLISELNIQPIQKLP
jgi:hypothetical protein